MINEANLISDELQRKIKFEVVLVREMPEGSVDMSEARTSIKVKVDNNEDGWYNMWDMDKFEGRMHMIRENLNQYFETEVMPDFSDKDKDAWWDPCVPLNVGTSYLSMKMLSYMMENDMTNAKILSSEGTKGNRGNISLRLEPVEVPEELEEAEPEDLLGKQINMKVMVRTADGLPEELCTDPYVEYKLAHETNNKVYKTGKAPRDPQTGKAESNCTWDYEQKHTIDCVTDYHLTQFENGNITFHVWASPYKKGSKGAAGVTQKF